MALVELRLVCIECGAISDERRDSWRAYLTSDDPPEAVVYCGDCAAREFGDES